MAKLSPKELSAILDAEKKDALSGDSSSKLTEERERAMNYYLGDMDADMKPPPDRSKAVSSDVFDTVEGLMPGLMEIFTGGEEVVSFEPQGEEDEKLAEQETDYVNYVFQRLNPGYVILYTMIKDALLQKQGLVKVWWDERIEEEEEVYADLDEAGMGLLTEDPEIEIIEIAPQGEDPSAQQPPPDAPLPAAGGPMGPEAPPAQMAGGMPPPPPSPEMGMPPAPPMEPGMNPMAAMGGPEGMPPMQGMPPMPPEMGMGGPAPMMGHNGGPPMLYTVTCRRRGVTGYARVEPVPPEEFGISRSAKSIEDSNYCFHQVKRTIADLISMGYDAEQVMSLGNVDPDDSGEAQARDTVDESSSGASTNLNKMSRLVDVTEHYVLLDYEDNKKPCLYKVVTGGDGTTEILEREGEPHIEKISEQPFAGMTPFIQPHRFVGRSIADAVIDIQRIKTSLLRSLLDNTYLANNSRMEVSEMHAGDNTIDDVMTNRPGGIVRTKMPGGLIPIPNQPIGNFVYPLVEYMDATREWRTGVTKQGMGLDPNALQNVGENAILDAANAARQKQKLIARTFAETGITSLFKLLHRVIRRNDTKANTVKLRNKWVTVDPREWKTRHNLICHVGLGSGSNQQQVAFLMNLLQIQREAIQQPQLKLVDAKKIYNTLQKLVEKGGLRTVTEFFTDPDIGPPVPAPPNPQVELEKMKIQGQQQAEQMKMQGQAQVEQMKLKAQMEATKMEAQIAQQKAQSDAAIKRMEAQMKAEVEKTQAEADIVSNNRKIENEMMLKRMEFDLKKELAIIEANLKAAELNQKLVTEISAELATPDDDEKGGMEKPYKRVIATLESQQANIQEMLEKVAERMGQAEDVAGRVTEFADGIMGQVEEIRTQVASPKRVQRDAEGRITGIIGANGVMQSVVRDPDTGAISGLQ